MNNVTYAYASYIRNNLMKIAVKYNNVYCSPKDTEEKTFSPYMDEDIWVKNKDLQQFPFSAV